MQAANPPGADGVAMTSLTAASVDHPEMVTSVTASLDDLLTRAAHGDHDAYRAFYTATSARVLSVCRRVLIGAAESEDAAQDVFLEAWTKAATFDRARGSALGWVLRIAHHRSVDRVRTAESSRRHHLVYTQLILAPGDQPSDNILRDCDSAEVREAMRRLSPLRRQALHYAFFTDHTYQQASTMLGIPMGTYKSRVRDAVIAVRDLLAAAAA